MLLVSYVMNKIFSVQGKKEREKTYPTLSCLGETSETNSWFDAHYQVITGWT